MSTHEWELVVTAGVAACVTYELIRMVFYGRAWASERIEHLKQKFGDVPGHAEVVEDFRKEWRVFMLVVGVVSWAFFIAVCRGVL